MTFHGSATCVLIDKTKMACWEFIALQPASVDKLAAVPVRFDGKDAASLMPTGAAAQVK